MAVVATNLAATASASVPYHGLLVGPLRVPLRQLAVNAGCSDVDQVVASVGDPASDVVLDARTGQLVPGGSGIQLDSAHVVRNVVESAAASARRPRRSCDAGPLGSCIRSMVSPWSGASG